MDAKATTTRLRERASETDSEKISLMKETDIIFRMLMTKGKGKGKMSSGDLNGESTTRRQVAQQEVGNNIQTGEHSGVCLFPFSSYNL
jgi:hypothetical protein